MSENQKESTQQVESGNTKPESTKPLDTQAVSEMGPEHKKKFAGALKANGEKVAATTKPMEKRVMENNPNVLELCDMYKIQRGDCDANRLADSVCTDADSAIKEVSDAACRFEGSKKAPEDFDALAKSVVSHIEKKGQFWKWDVEVLMKIMDTSKLPPATAEKAERAKSKSFPKIANSLLKNGFPIADKRDVEVLKKLSPWDKELITSAEKALSTGKKTIIQRTPEGKLLTVPMNRDYFMKTSPETVKKLGFTNQQDLAPGKATTEQQNNGKTTNESGKFSSNAEAKDEIDAMVASDNAIISGIGKMLKVLLTVTGHYKSWESEGGVDAGKESKKESPLDARIKKIGEMKEKGGKSPTYFPAKASETGLEPVNTSGDKQKDEALNKERSDYIIDTRSALGLPTDKTEQNKYDAEVIKKVKEIQKKAGVKETWVFDTKTADELNKTLAAEKTQAEKKSETTPASPQQTTETKKTETGTTTPTASTPQKGAKRH